MKLRELEKWVRHLATVDENESLVVSAYVDLRQDALATDGAFLSRIASVRNSLSGERAKEFDAAVRRIHDAISETDPRERKSVAYFVREGGADPYCHELAFEVPVETSVGVDFVPNIYPLVEMKDRYHRYVVALVDGGSVRVLEINLGAVTAEVWRERPELRERVGREWTRQHYQRHEQAVNERFLKEAVDVLRQRMERGGYKHLILVGNPVSTARIEAWLPRSLRDQVVQKLPLGPSEHDQAVVRATLDAFLEEERRESSDMVAHLEHHLHKTGLAVVGRDESWRALMSGAADVLVLSTALDPSLREELVRLAEKSSAEIELVEANSTLERWGGVGCLLRYRSFGAGRRTEPSPAEGSFA